MTSVAISYAGSSFWASHTDRLVSEESYKELKHESHLWDRFSTERESRMNAVRELRVLFDETSEDNWDCHGGKAIDWRSIENAARLLVSFPFNIPVPDISPDPAGEVTFEWYRAPHHMVSMSIGANNELTYAGLFGINSTHGEERFDDEVPMEILQLITRHLEEEI